MFGLYLYTSFFVFVGSLFGINAGKYAIDWGIWGLTNKKLQNFQIDIFSVINDLVFDPEILPKRLF